VVEEDAETGWEDDGTRWERESARCRLDVLLFGGALEVALGPLGVDDPCALGLLPWEVWEEVLPMVGGK
jgi:hypothetical protein